MSYIISLTGELPAKFIFWFLINFRLRFCFRFDRFRLISVIAILLLTYGIVNYFNIRFGLILGRLNKFIR